MLKTIGDFFVFCIIWWFTLPWRLLPYDGCLWLGRALTAMLYPIARKHRRIADENIRHAFPELSADERRKMIREHFRHLGHMAADALYGPRLNDRFFEERVEFTPGSKDIERAAMEAGKNNGTGIIFLTGHLGTWELLVQYTGRVLNGGGIYKPLSNKFVDRWYKKIRESSGIQLFTMEETPGVLRWLKQGGFMGVVADQNARGAGIFVDFLNRPASTFQGPAVLASMAGARILVYTAVHLAGGRIRIKIRDLGVLDKSVKNQYESRDALVREYTQRWVSALEEDIREYPEQYFWLHRRWKYTPEHAERDRRAREERRREGAA